MPSAKHPQGQPQDWTWQLINANYAHFQHRESSGTDGGTLQSGAWRIRPINTTIVNAIAGVSLASDQLTLPAGDYRMCVAAVGFDVQQHKLRIRDITHGVTLALGLNVGSTASDANTEIPSYACGHFTLAEESVIEVQHYCTATNYGDGMGDAIGSGEDEVYADVELWHLE